jgi:glycosyltransferase involved in cell wall biosynthesis
VFGEDVHPSVNVAWLTINPNLGASARSLQDWILLGRQEAMRATVALRTDGDLRRWLAAERIPYMLNPMPWPDRANALRSVMHAWKATRWMKGHKAQCIHCYEHDLYPFAVVLRMLTSLPLVCHVHFAPERDFLLWAFGSPRKLPDAVIWTSAQQQKDCASAIDGIVSPERQHVVPLGLDLRRFGSQAAARDATRRELGIGVGDVVVGAASALRGRKRIDDFLDLVRALRERHSNVVGLLAGGEVPGDEAYAREVIPRIRAAEAAGGFRWLGNLEPVEPFMHAIDIFVSTSEYETFGMSVLEAMACAKPVVAYRGGAVHEVVGDSGSIVSTADLADLIASVERLIVDRQLRVELGEAAKRRVAMHYDPRKSLNQLLQIYGSIRVPRSPAAQ